MLSLFALSVSIASLVVHAYPGLALLERQTAPGRNTSALLPGWSGDALCFDSNPLLGPSFTSSVMTIELCVDLCDEEGYRLAGVAVGDGCQCGNFLNEFFVSKTFPSLVATDDTLCDGVIGIPCVGNPREACGSTPVGVDNPTPGVDAYAKTCALNFFTTQISFTAGGWRFIYPYNDTVGARALPHNAVDLNPSLPRGNLTVELCVNACAANGFILAGVEFADECYCGNALENNSQEIPGCTPTAGEMPCKGNPRENCGGPNMLFLYGLPASLQPALTPLLPYDPEFNGF